MMLFRSVLAEEEEDEEWLGLLLEIRTPQHNVAEFRYHRDTEVGLNLSTPTPTVVNLGTYQIFADGLVPFKEDHTPSVILRKLLFPA